LRAFSRWIRSLLHACGHRRLNRVRTRPLLVPFLPERSVCYRRTTSASTFRRMSCPTRCATYSAALASSFRMDSISAPRAWRRPPRPHPRAPAAHPVPTSYITKLLPNNQRQHIQKDVLCWLLCPVSAALSSIFRMDSISAPRAWPPQPGPLPPATAARPAPTTHQFSSTVERVYLSIYISV